MGDLLQPWHLIVLPFVLIFPAFIMGVIPFWFICKKAGFSPMLTFLNIVPFPLGTLVLVYLLAFADWKVVPIAQTLVGYPYPPPPPPPQT
jgi:hypothetical protein